MRTAQAVLEGKTVSMNLYWIAGIALFVLFEKTVPAGHWLGYAAGVALLVWGAAMLLLAF